LSALRIELAIVAGAADVERGSRRRKQHPAIYALIFVNGGALFCGAAFTNKEPE
jgi:hypothetical protein